MYRLTVLLVVVVLACGGSKAPETTPSPTGGARTLTSVDPDLSGIAKAAARSLQPGSDGKVKFGGVFVAGRELTALGDTIARAIGATRIGGSRGSVPFAICRMGSPGCADGPDRDDASYTFTSFRLAGDVAFVGTDAKSINQPDGALCIALSRAGGAWLVKEKRVVPKAESCGK